MKEGRFIVLEGIDGCGKDTQIKKLCNYLWDTDTGNHILVTREPTKVSPAGRRAREMLASGADPYQYAEKFAELFVDDRRWHIREMVQPALSAGVYVVCSRYILSTLAYQSMQGVPLDELELMHRIGFIEPDIGFLVDIDVVTALERIADERGSREVFEREEFQKGLREKYISLARKYNYKIIDGAKNIDEVFSQIRTHLEALI